MVFVIEVLCCNVDCFFIIGYEIDGFIVFNKFDWWCGVYGGFNWLYDCCIGFIFVYLYDMILVVGFFVFKGKEVRWSVVERNVEVY